MPSESELPTNKDDNSYSNDSATTDGAVVSLLKNDTNGHGFSLKESEGIKDRNKIAESNKEELSNIPIDKGWAWVIVGACFVMHILVVGALKSFGVLFVEFRDKYSVSSRGLGLVQGIVITMMLSLGLGANLLALRFTSQKVVFIGGVLTALGFILSAYIPSFEFLYLTYGLITGLGFALAYSPCVVMVGIHFKKRRSLANGISVSGSGVGSFIFPNIMRWMLNEYGLSGCLLLFGGIMLNICVCAMLLRPLSSYAAKKITKKSYTHNLNEKNCDLQQLMKVKKMKHVTEMYDSKNASQNGHVQCSDSQKVYLPEYASNGDIHMMSLQSIPPEEMQNMAAGFCARIKCSCCKKLSESTDSRKGPKLFNWSLLSNPLFLIYATSCGLANFGLPNIFIMLPAFAESHGQDRDSAALILSIIGITDLAGRLFFGWCSDFKLIPRRFGFVGGLAISGVLNLLIPIMTSFAGMAVIGALYGFFAGSFFALISVMLADALGVEKLSSSYGLATLAMSIGLLPGPLICGEINDATSKWDYAFIFCGIMTILGSIPPLFEPCAKSLVDAKEQRRSENDKIVTDL